MKVQRLYFISLLSAMVIVITQSCSFRAMSVSIRPGWIDKPPTSPDSIYALGVSPYIEEVLVYSLVDLAGQKSIEVVSMREELPTVEADTIVIDALKDWLTYSIGNITLRSLSRQFWTARLHDTDYYELRNAIHLEYREGGRHYSTKAYTGEKRQKSERPDHIHSLVSMDENASIDDVIKYLCQIGLGIGTFHDRDMYYVLSSAALADLEKFQLVKEGDYDIYKEFPELLEEAWPARRDLREEIDLYNEFKAREMFDELEREWEEIRKKEEQQKKRNSPNQP